MTYDYEAMRQFENPVMPYDEMGFQSFYAQPGYPPQGPPGPQGANSQPYGNQVPNSASYPVPNPNNPGGFNAPSSKHNFPRF
jgi:hypothetical protein